MSAIQINMCSLDFVLELHTKTKLQNKSIERFVLEEHRMAVMREAASTCPSVQPFLRRTDLLKLMEERQKARGTVAGRCGDSSLVLKVGI